MEPLTRTFKFHKPHLLFCEVWAKFNLLKYKAGVSRRLYLKVKKETKLSTFTFTKKKGLNIWTRKDENPGVMERRGRAGHFHEMARMYFSRTRMWCLSQVVFELTEGNIRCQRLLRDPHLFIYLTICLIFLRCQVFWCDHDISQRKENWIFWAQVQKKNCNWKLLFLTVTLILHPGRVRVRDLAPVSCHSKRTPAVHTESDLSSS